MDLGLVVAHLHDHLNAAILHIELSQVTLDLLSGYVKTILSIKLDQALKRSFEELVVKRLEL